jgi:hypothetical protein
LDQPVPGISTRACEIPGAVLQTPAVKRFGTPAFSFAPQGLRPRARLAGQPAAYRYWRFS